MIDILNIPTYDPDPERTRQELQGQIIKQGRIARRMGHPCEPPPFRLDDWEADWRNGWRWEDEDIEKQEKIDAERAKLSG